MRIGVALSLLLGLFVELQMPLSVPSLVLGMLVQTVVALLVRIDIVFVLLLGQFFGLQLLLLGLNLGPVMLLQ